MKKVLILFMLSILFFITDNVLMPFFAIKTIYPSLIFVFVVCYSIINGKWEGLWLGVFCGLLQDIYFSNMFGANALINMIICLIAGRIGDNIFKEKRLIPVISSFLLSVLKGMLLISVLYFAKINASLKDVLFIGIYNMLVSLVMYSAIFKLCEREYMQKRWKF